MPMTDGPLTRHDPAPSTAEGGLVLLAAAVLLAAVVVSHADCRGYPALEVATDGR